MAKSKKIKIYIGLFYTSAVSLFLFSYFLSLVFKKSLVMNLSKIIVTIFIIYDNQFIYIRYIIYFICSTMGFAAGFGSPLALFAGFIFGKWFGLLFAVIGMTIGATLLYMFANFFLKDVIRNKFLNRFENLEEKFRKSEFIYLLIYRFVGGIPFQIQNVLPCIFNVKVSNFFWSTLLGMIPSLFIVISIGSGIEEIIDQNLQAPSMIELITSSSIYIPLIAFFFLLIIKIFFRKLFYKN